MLMSTACHGEGEGKDLHLALHKWDYLTLCFVEGDGKCERHDM